MSGYRTTLPQLHDQVFLADGGIETTLIFHDGLDLPDFAAFVLLSDEAGRSALRRYYTPYLDLAAEAGRGLVLETATWRASSDWGARLGYDRADLERANREAVDLLVGLRRERESPSTPVLISGCVGPRGDGYRPDALLSPDEAQAYHRQQVEVLADTPVDLVSAITMTHTGEAIGFVRAAADAGVPSVVSFTVETDGRLPSGETLGEAVTKVDQATGSAAAYFMVNCMHPTHLGDGLARGDGWQRRIRGIRANASTMSHAELDEAETLDVGDPVDLGARYAALRLALPQLTVLGGCCGTDVRHVRAISEACAA
jgi:homocysteine S-methyltransferase